jgi:hypothetical protein
MELQNPEPDKWYSQEAWLNAFKEIAETVGTNTLFMIGKSIPEHAKFPPQIDLLRKRSMPLTLPINESQRR